jgi:hypothetical protein
MAALREEMFRLSLLKVPAADFSTGDLCGDSQDGHTAAVTIVKAID